MAAESKDCARCGSTIDSFGFCRCEEGPTTPTSAWRDLSDAAADAKDAGSDFVAITTATADEILREKP